MTAQFTESVILSSRTRTAGHYIDWERASLVFQDAPIQSVLQELRLWYGYEFKMLDTINRREHITATFPVNDQREMLRLLSRVVAMNATIRDLTVELSPIRVHRSPQSKRDIE
jgi:ferric-dicitrate binding protein FerR (iron transport regulator)